MLNIWDIVILVILGTVLALALRSRRRAKQNGSSCCSAGCDKCAGCASAKGKNE